MLVRDELDRETIMDLLRALTYWYKRFKESRDVDHFDHALRCAEALEDYLPKPLRGLNLVQLSNLYEILPGTHNLKS
jgi:hypothetical protein